MSTIFDQISPKPKATQPVQAKTVFDAISQPPQPPQPQPEAPKQKTSLDGGMFGSHGFAQYLGKPETEGQTAAREAFTQGLTGKVPSQPELQSKHPYRTSAALFAGGIAPYFIPGGAAWQTAKFATIPTAQKMVELSTSPETKDLNRFQVGAKVFTAGASGAIVGQIFKNADLLKTIAQRVAAASLGAGGVSGVESVAQDIESGRAPDIKQAFVNAGMSALTIGVLKGVVEAKVMRPAVIREANMRAQTDPANVLRKGARKPMNYEQSKAYLTREGVDVNSLSPILQDAVQQAKGEAILREKGVNPWVQALGIKPKVIKSVLRDQNVASRLNTIDNEIYLILKRATGREPTFDWRAGLDYKWDYSVLNPKTANQVKALITFRTDIAKGMHPTDAILSYEIAKNLKTKEYIAEILKKSTRDLQALHADYIKANETPMSKPAEFFGKGIIETAGKKLTKSKLPAPNNERTMAYLPYFQNVLDSLRKREKQRALEDPQYVPIDVPDAANMNNIQRDQLMSEVGGILENEGDKEVGEYLTKKLVDNPLQEYSFISTPEGKEDAAKTVVYDWRRFREVEVKEAAANLKQLNIQRKKAGLPEISFDDVIVHRNVYHGQTEGVADQVREAFIREYKRAKVDKLVPGPETPTLPTNPTEPTPTEPTVIDIAKQALERQQKSALDERLAMEGLDEEGIKLAKEGFIGEAVDRTLKETGLTKGWHIEEDEDTGGRRFVSDVPMARSFNMGTMSHGDALGFAYEDAVENISRILQETKTEETTVAPQDAGREILDEAKSKKVIPSLDDLISEGKKLSDSPKAHLEPEKGHILDHLAKLEHEQSMIRSGKLLDVNGNQVKIEPWYIEMQQADIKRIRAKLKALGYTEVDEELTKSDIEELERRKTEIEQSPIIIEDDEIKPINKPMYYKMPADQNLTGKDTSTLDLAEQGLRTSTTRSQPLGEVGDIVTFENRPTQYRVTGTHKITAADMRNPDFIKKLSQTEQWTEDAIKTRHKFQIKPGAVVTYYEIVQPSEDLQGKQGLVDREIIKEKVIKDMKKSSGKYFYHVSPVLEEIVTGGLKTGGISDSPFLEAGYGDFVHVFNNGGLPSKTTWDDVSYSGTWKLVKPMATFTWAELNIDETRLPKGARASEEGYEDDPWEPPTPEELVVMEGVEIERQRRIKAIYSAQQDKQGLTEAEAEERIDFGKHSSGEAYIETSNIPMTHGGIETPAQKIFSPKKSKYAESSLPQPEGKETGLWANKGEKPVTGDSTDKARTFVSGEAAAQDWGSEEQYPSYKFLTEEGKAEAEAERVKESELAREIVEGKHDIYYVIDVAKALEAKLGRTPTTEELSAETGMTLQEIREVRADGFRDAFPDIGADEYETIHNTDTDVVLEVGAVKDILDQLCNSMSTKDQEDALWLLEHGLERIKGQNKIYYKSLFVESDASKLKRIAEGQNMGFGSWYDTDPYWKRKVNKWRYQQTAKRILNLRKIAEDIVSQRPYLIETYLKEIKDLVEGTKRKEDFLENLSPEDRKNTEKVEKELKDLEMAPQSKKIIDEAISGLKKTSTFSEVLYAAHKLGDAISRNKDKADRPFTTGLKLSDAERGGGATFSVEEPQVVETTQGEIALEPGEYDWYKDGENFSMFYQGKTFIIPQIELNKLISKNAIRVSYERYVDDVSDDDKAIEADDEPWTMNESGQAAYSTAFERWQRRILKHTEADRHAPMLTVLKFMRDLPYIADLRKHFTTTQKEKEKESKLRDLWKVEDDPHDQIMAWRMYESAVRSIAWTDLQPVHDDVLENVQNFLIAKGLKGKKKEVYQDAFDVYSSLMAVASQEVMVNSYDPNNYGPTKLGNGPHLSPEEVKAHIAAAKRFTSYFGIPMPREGTQDIMDANGQPTGSSTEVGTLRHSRNQFFWNLLVHPNVMNNNSLQRAILFYKAQIEMPLLEEQIKNGIYSNADIWKTIQEGYHKKGWEEKGQQKYKGGFGKKGGLTGIERPSRTARSQEEFVQQGEEQGWVAIDDFFNDNFEYMVEALRGVKQAQLLKALKKIPMTGQFEYEDKELQALNKANPSPYKFNWIEFESNDSPIKEAERMSKLSGRTINVHKILQEGGWVQGKMEYGLDKWYRGSFQPPYIYKSLFNEIRSLWEQKQSFDDLRGLGKILQYLKMSLTVNPLDSAAQYLANIFADRPAWQVIPFVAGVIPRTIFFGIKGLAKTGPDIWKGTHEGTPVAKTPYEKAMARMLLEAGMTSAAGFKAFLHNLVDKVDKGVFPQRQSKAEDISNYIWSVGGSYEAIMSEMVAHDILQVAIRLVEQKVEQGKSLPEAVKWVAYHMNTASWNLHRDSFQGNVGNHLRNWTISRNFAVAPIRMLMIMMYSTPLGAPLKKAGVYNFKTIGGDGKGEGRWQNAFTGADIPERFLPEISQKFLGMFAKVLFWDIFIKMTIQYALSMMDDDEIDFHGEVGALVKNPKKRNMFDNPGNLKNAVYSGLKNINGNPIFFDFGLFKLVNNILDITSTVVDPALQKATGNKDIHTGRGVLSFLKSKLGVVIGQLELAFNRNFDDGSKIYDVSEGISWENARRILEKEAESSPINPWLGPSSVEVPFSKDPLIDNLIKSYLTVGGVAKVGPAFNKRVTSEQFRKMKETANQQKFRDEEVTRKIKTLQQVKEAYDKKLISGEQAERRSNAIKFQVDYFRRQNQRTLWKAKKQK